MNNTSIPSKEILEDMYVKQKLPIHKIADKLNMSVGKIYSFIKKYNIKTRDKKEVFTMKGRKWTIEQRKHKSEQMKGNTLSESIKEKLRGSKVGIGSKKIRSDGYIAIYFPDHPKSNKDGYIMEHDLVMECLIGRWLNDDEVVHHKNKIRSDNRKNNLVLMTKSEHARMHTLERRRGN